MPCHVRLQVFTAGLGLLATAVVFSQAAAATQGWSGLVAVARHGSEAAKVGLDVTFTHLFPSAHLGWWYVALLRLSVPRPFLRPSAPFAVLLLLL